MKTAINEQKYSNIEKLLIQIQGNYLKNEKVIKNFKNTGILCFLIF